MVTERAAVWAAGATRAVWQVAVVCCQLATAALGGYVGCAVLVAAYYAGALR